jgi:hypothetical protein
MLMLSLRLLGGGYARSVSPPRAEGRANVAGAIYGQILVTSFVAALSEVVDVDAGEIFTSLLVTMLVFWLAHVYADAVAQRLEREDSLTWREVWSIAKYEWPGLQAAVPALVAVGLGWAGALSTLTAVRLAIALGVVALLAWVCHRARLAAVCARDAWIGRPQWRVRVGHRHSQALRRMTTIGETGLRWKGTRRPTRAAASAGSVPP